jgi:hypothetical protein
MEWLKENVANIGAILFALYMAARMIAALTPTPQDDKAVEKVGILLKIIAKGVGIDIKQGLKKRIK